MGVIEWLPIAEMPDALKDGRDVLVWFGEAAVAFYDDVSEQWRSTDYSFAEEQTSHFAEINPPAVGNGV